MQEIRPNVKRNKNRGIRNNVGPSKDNWKQNTNQNNEQKESGENGKPKQRNKIKRENNLQTKRQTISGGSK